MKRAIGDSDAMRRQNRGLVLDALRRLGPRSRTLLARETGLSHATITAISADMMQQGLLQDLPEEQGDVRARGRPATNIGFRREAGYVLLLDITVNRARVSLVDYSGTSVDRIEMPLGAESFLTQSPTDFVAARITQMAERNPEAAPSFLKVAASVQGILDRDAGGLKWSPVRNLADHPLVAGVEARSGLAMTIYKRGRLLAEGSRLLFPELGAARVATVFVGSTISMGLSLSGHDEAPALGQGVDTATEFGHMVHQPDGALCRCGTRGCIEAYAADYGVLRTAYGVPANTPPAADVPAAQYQELINRARHGDRNAMHAFNIAGQALGFGLNRLMTVFDPSHIVVVGPGAQAFDHMRREMEAALAASLVARVQGVPDILTHGDESGLVHQGLMTKALREVDQTMFAALPVGSGRMEVAQ